jgi:hypothetical protein
LDDQPEFKLDQGLQASLNFIWASKPPPGLLASENVPPMR